MTTDIKLIDQFANWAESQTSIIPRLRLVLLTNVHAQLQLQVLPNQSGGDSYKSGHTLLCYFSQTQMFNKPASEASLLNKRLMLSSSFRYYQIYKYEIYDFGDTLLCYLSWTQMFHKPASGSLNKCSCRGAPALGVTKFTAA